MVLSSIAYDAGKKLFGIRQEEQQALEQSQRETQTEIPLSGTLAVGEEKVVNFRSAEKDSPLRKYRPFNSVDAISVTNERCDIYINERDANVLPVPGNTTQGDSFENTGVSSIKIVNNGNNPIDFDNEDVTVFVSGTPEGVKRSAR